MLVQRSYSAKIVFCLLSINCREEIRHFLSSLIFCNPYFFHRGSEGEASKTAAIILLYARDSVYVNFSNTGRTATRLKVSEDVDFIVKNILYSVS
jgi:hypothetical protein